VGTRVLTGRDNRIDRGVMKDLAGQVSDLMDRGTEVVLVSSGAIGAGLGLLKLRKKGRSLSELQAIASVGQNHLMDIYNEYFNKRKYNTGQMLLTQEDLNDRKRFLNIRYTLNTLLKYKAVPIINENDSVSTEEIKCGDNDRLSSLVADLANSDMLIILTDVEGLYGDDLKIIRYVEDIDLVIEDLKTFCREKGCDVSTGGMVTKLEAARNAAKSGITCVVAGGRQKNVIIDAVDGRETGTYFKASEKTIKARKRWIAFSRKSKGWVKVDKGAEKALTEKNRSLLPGGITKVSGRFAQGDVIDVLSASRKIIARGISNYSYDEIEKIKGKKTDQIEKELGYKDYDEVVHRDNLVLM